MIPTKEQWEKAWTGLDEAHAFDHFYGKTLKEAENMIQDASEYYWEDFLWMPKIPFRFYFKAFKNYLNSPKSKYDFFAADSFIIIIENILENKYDWVEDSWKSIVYVLNKIVNEPNFLKPEKIFKRVNRVLAEQAEKKV